MSKRHYIDLSPLLNTRAYIKEAITDKGDGKTTALVKIAIQSRLDTGLTPVFCRRFSAAVGKQFKNDVLEKIKLTHPDLYNKCNFEWKGNLKHGGIYLVDKDDKEGRPYMHAFPLSMIDNMKSGLDVSTHRNIYIDEYVPMNGRYLPNEFDLIWELYRTVDRDKLLEYDPYLNYILIAGNRIGRTPVTDIALRIDHDYSKNGLCTYKNETVAVLSYANKGHVEQVKNSRMDDLLEGTAYQEYARGGQLRPTRVKTFVKQLQGFPFVYIRGENGWCKFYMRDNAVILVDNPSEPQGRTVPQVSITPALHGLVWIKAVDSLCQYVHKAVAAGEFYFDNEKTAERHLDIVKYLVKL